MARRALAESILSIGANRAVTVPASATLRVRERGGTALATVYSASTGGTAITNPVTVTNGLPTGYVEMGSYDLMATASGVDSETWEWEALVATSVESRVPTGISAVAYGDSRFPDQPTSVTEGGITTTYTYNADGSYATRTCNSVTETFSYTNGVLTGSVLS